MIYEIVCNETGERYIGSTFEPTLAKRMRTHRSEKSRCISKQIIGRGNYTYGLLEKVDISSRDELRMKEREWYEKKPNINIRRPYVTEEERIQKRKEYDKKKWEENKEQLKEQFKAYIEKNKEETRIKRRIRYLKQFIPKDLVPEAQHNHPKDYQASLSQVEDLLS